MSWHDVVPWLADALVLLGMAVMTTGVYGLFRMPDIYTKLHAVSKAVVLGAIAIASLASGQAAIIDRVLLISGLLLLTTPVSAHVIGRAAFLAERRGEPLGHVELVEASGSTKAPGWSSTDSSTSSE